MAFRPKDYTKLASLSLFMLWTGTKDEEEDRHDYLGFKYMWSLFFSALKLVSIHF